MKILCNNGWIKSNLGDLWMAEIIVKKLHSSGHEVSVASEGFPCSWNAVPCEKLHESQRDWNKANRQALFARFDKVIHLPGGGLQGKDFRMQPMMADIKLAAEMNLPYALAANSICPQVSTASLSKASFLQSREPVTSRWLHEQGLRHAVSVDVTWSDVIHPVTQREQTVLILRYDGNILAKDAEAVSSHELLLNGQRFSIRGELIVSTSDAIKDADLGTRLAARLNCRWRPCHTIDELKHVIASASLLITD